MTCEACQGTRWLRRRALYRGVWVTVDLPCERRAAPAAPGPDAAADEPAALKVAGGPSEPWRSGA